MGFDKPIAPVDPVEARILALLQHGGLALEGCAGGHLAWVIARLASRRGLIVALTPDEERARELAADVVFFLGEQADPVLALERVLHLPQVETSPYAEMSPDRASLLGRMAVLYRLAVEVGDLRQPRVLVASARSWRRRVMPPATLRALCGTVRVDDEIDRDTLARRLIAAGFSRARVVDDPGTFALRGGIVDLYPPLNRYPARVELYGDQVESIRLFDPETQRTLRAVDSIAFHPVRETVGLPEADVRGRVLEVADRAQFPSRATRALLEEIESGREFLGIEAFAPAFHRRLVPLSEFLPPAALHVAVDPPALREVLEAEDQQARTAHAARLAGGRLGFAPEEFFVEAEPLLAELGRGPILLLPPLPPELRPQTLALSARDNADIVAELRRARSERGEEILKPLVARLKGWLAERRPVRIAAGGLAAAERLRALLGEHGLPLQLRREPGAPDLLDEGAPAAGIVLQVGELSRGFRLDRGLVVVSEEEVFGPKVHRPAPRRGRGLLQSDLRDLAAGDHVVHRLHGIGRYQGLVNLEVSGVPADFLLLEYAGGDRLYLPIYRMDQVQRYLAGEGRPPKLDRLGGVTWQKKRSRVEREVRRFGEELLQLYAQRAALAGRAYDPPDAVYAEFEATFPFSETPDQLQAVQDVIGDLTAPRPMDRLVCGDVGFGKTEVALRAAFVVAQAGKQVALLAPTTVLVEQHHRTFVERMAPYPFRIEALSRFRRPAEARQVVAELHSGLVDIVVGTHRLLSSDVAFRDLGLLIIDEEQRFGVAHKERLKRLRTQVDVLTLTATPIPRTLQMGMIGLREISVIATAPADRLSVRTFVTRYDDALVAQSIQKELDRGGQVFFVHNRVESIDRWAARLRALMPGVRVAVAHGQMDSRRLERVMVDFVSGAYDLLVCTAIIESGLDIPRANTMLVNRADSFGLSQLYQLRGRIGRSRHRAYCYLLVPGIEAMSGEARQRLATLQRFSELGSGFSVATHDLEIRGAGELLGARQSGQIAAVGFETYARILEEAVSELRGEPIHRETDPEINITVAAYIPDDYVEDIGQRLELYQRLSQAARQAEALAEIVAEIDDRYGPHPPEVDALVALMVVKGLAARLGARVVDLSESRLSLTLDESTPLDPAEVRRLVSDRSSGFRLTPKMQLIRTLAADERDDPLGAARKILHGLVRCANQAH